MKKTIILLTIALVCVFILLLLFGRSLFPKENASMSLTDMVAAGKIIAYQLDTAQSILEWKAGHSGKSNDHIGTLQITEGSLILSPDSIIKAGKFTIDVNSVQMKGHRNEGLEEHLRSDDFLAGLKFPKCYFVITGNTKLSFEAPVTIQGNLTLRGFVNQLSFPVTFHEEKDAIRAEASLSIDRTRWGITYESEKLIPGLKKEDAISNLVPITLNLVFKK